MDAAKHRMQTFALPLRRTLVIAGRTATFSLCAFVTVFLLVSTYHSLHSAPPTHRLHATRTAREMP
jgi:hypothetical protein